MSTETADVVIPTTVRLEPVLRRQLEDAARSSFRTAEPRDRISARRVPEAV